MEISIPTLSTFGYVFTAALYLKAWANPRTPSGGNLVRWVAFEKLCLTEFLSCHAITLLAGTALYMQSEGGKEMGAEVWWGLISLYFILGSAAYLFHRNHRALVGFYSILVTRSLGIISLQTANEDMLKFTLLKNFFMFPLTMLLIASIAFRHDGDTWQEAFISGQFRIGEKISRGRNILLVTVFYLIWALVEWTISRYLR